MATITSAASGDWDASGTWDAGVPASGDDVVVTGAHDVAINVDVTCASLTTTAYSGTLTQNAGQEFTVDGDIAWSGGTFTGGDSAITAEAFALTGGTWTSTSDTFSVDRGAGGYIAETLFLYSGGTFTHSSGTVRFDYTQGGGVWSILTLDCTSTPTFNNVTFEGGRNSASYSVKWTLSGSATVAGDLSINPDAGRYLLLDGGTYSVGGNISSAAGASGGTSVISLAGTSTYSGVTAGKFPKLQILAGATVTAATADATCQSFSQTGGSFTCPTGTFSIDRGAGNNIAETLFLYSGGTFTHGGGSSTVRFDYLQGSSVWSVLTLDCTSTPTFNNVTFEGGRNSASYPVKWTLSGTANVAGDLIISPDAGYYLLLDGGAYSVAGDLSCAANSNGGTTAITLSGTGVQTVTQTAGSWPAGAWTNSNTAGHVIQATNVTLGGALTTATDSRWCQETYDLAVTGTVTNNGALIKDNAGVSSPTIGSGNAVEIGPCVAVVAAAGPFAVGAFDKGWATAWR